MVCFFPLRRDVHRRRFNYVEFQSVAVFSRAEIATSRLNHTHAHAQQLHVFYIYVKYIKIGRGEILY